MCKSLIPLAVVASLGLASAAAAATTVGTVHAIDPHQAKVTLSTGDVFDFDATAQVKARLDTFKPGDSVSINWITIGTSQGGLAISPLN